MAITHENNTFRLHYTDLFSSDPESSVTLVGFRPREFAKDVYDELIRIFRNTYEYKLDYQMLADETEGAEWRRQHFEARKVEVEFVIHDITFDEATAQLGVDSPYDGEAAIWVDADVSGVPACWLLVEPNNSEIYLSRKDAGMICANAVEAWCEDEAFAEAVRAVWAQDEASKATGVEPDEDIAATEIAGTMKMAWLHCTPGRFGRVDIESIAFDENEFDDMVTRFEEESSYGYPFANYTCYTIERRDIDSFLASGFRVFEYENNRDSWLIAGIDGGGYNFADEHFVWVPLNRNGANKTLTLYLPGHGSVEVDLDPYGALSTAEKIAAWHEGATCLPAYRDWYFVPRC